MTGEELRTWREKSGLSPLQAAEVLGLELWQFTAYESGRLTIPRYLERQIAVLNTRKPEN